MRLPHLLLRRRRPSPGKWALPPDDKPKDRKLVKEVKRTMGSTPSDGKGSNQSAPHDKKKKRMPFGLENFDELEEMMDGFE
jgi:hypothetical protein